MRNIKIAFKFTAPKKNKSTQFKQKIQILKEMKQYIFPFLHKNPIVTKSLGKSYLLLALSKLCFFGGPLFLKKGINGLQNATLFDPLLMFFGYGICYSASVLFQSLRNLQTAKVVAIALNQTAQKAYRHILSLDPDFFFAGPQRHRLFNLYKAQTAIQQNLKAMTQYFLPIALDIIMSVALLLYYSGSWFVVSFLTCYSAYSVFTIKYSQYRKKHIKQQRQSEKQLDFITAETFANYYNVKYFGKQNQQLEKYKQAMIKFYQRVYQTQISLGILNTTQRVIFGAGLTFNMILAAYYTQIGLLTTGDIIMIQTLMLQFLNPLFFLGTMYRSFTDTFIDVKQLRDILESPPKVRQGKQKMEICSGNIKFQNIAFHYGNQQNQILENLNFSIKENQFVAIVGPSGVGKSTILQLIFRLYDPQQGSIYIDNQNIKNLNFDYRKHISFVSQTPYLFNGTVMQNLKYANANVSDERVYQLTKQLNLHDLIMQLPKKYNTNVGEKGSIFSGGEKQRIALIRALLRQCKIMLLDQPTSSLDSVNEFKVCSLLQKYHNCTRIVITHRSSMMQYSDRVIKIQKS